MDLYIVHYCRPVFGTSTWRDMIILEAYHKGWRPRQKRQVEKRRVGTTVLAKQSGYVLVSCSQWILEWDNSPRYERVDQEFRSFPTHIWSRKSEFSMGITDRISWAEKKCYREQVVCVRNFLSARRCPRVERLKASAPDSRAAAKYIEPGRNSEVRQETVPNRAVESRPLKRG